MQINQIKLRNFRNHKNIQFEFDDKLTLIVGANGSGKTSILEAIFILATGKSQKARYDKDLISYEHKFCAIAGEVINQDDNYNLDLKVEKTDETTNYSSKKATVNKVVKSISGFTGIFNAVMFSPEDISVITGSPAERRRFLDLLLSQTDKNYKRDHSSYTKAVRQRNKILETINEQSRGRNQLDFWNEQITKFGQSLHQKRLEFFDYAQKNLPNVVKNIEHTKISIELEYKESLITPARLESYQEKEIAAKSTLIGPHREDFSLSYNGHDIAEFGSRGQQRTVMLILKLLEIGFIEQTKGERPVLLLDDIFSELDDSHRKAVMDVIDKQQTIITSAEDVRILGLSATKTVEL